MRGAPQRDAFAAFSILGVLALALLLVTLDADRRRAAAVHADQARLAVVRATGLSDPFLSSGSRWARHPSQSEPAAALSDAPDGLDVDPAGLAIEAFDGPLEPVRFVRLPPEPVVAREAGPR